MIKLGTALGAVGMSGTAGLIGYTVAPSNEKVVEVEKPISREEAIKIRCFLDHYPHIEKGDQKLDQYIKRCEEWDGIPFDKKPTSFANAYFDRLNKEGLLKTIK